MKIGSTMNLKSSPHIISHGRHSVYFEEWGSKANVFGLELGFTNEIYYQKIGNVIFMNVNLAGTSVSSVLYFNLPYKIENEAYINTTARVKDNGTYSTAPGRVQNRVQETQNGYLELVRDPSSGVAWTSSGAKEWIGQFAFLTSEYSPNYDFYGPDGQTDWASGAAVTGFSALTVNRFHYYRVGNIVFCRLYYSGTSNATTITATLPFPCSLLINNMSGMVTNNGTRLSTSGLAEITAGSSTLNLYRDGLKTAFTNSGSKIWAGWFFYFTD